MCVNCVCEWTQKKGSLSLLPNADRWFVKITLIKNTEDWSDSWSASVSRIIQTGGSGRIMQTPTWFNIITADVIENVLRFKEGYLNKSYYQYAEAVFTSQGGRHSGGKSEREEKEWMTKRRRIDEESERDVKWCLTEMRNKEKRGGGVRRYDNRFTSEPNQFSFLTSSRPADD